MNAAGDQVPMQEQDEYKYLPSHWNPNSVWQLHYNDIVNTFTAMEEIEKYRPAANRITSYNVCYTKLLRQEDIQ